MLTFDQVENHAKAYSNITTDELNEAKTEDLHSSLSQRLCAQEEVTDSKKAFNGAANELLKKIRNDVLSINREIRRRLQPEQERRVDHEVIAIELLDSGLDAAVAV